MKRKNRQDSVQSQIKSRQNLTLEVAVPEGVRVETDEEKILWGHLTSARDKTEWRLLDLWILGKMVGYEVDIRRHRDMLSRTSVLLENKRGTMVPNPLISVIDTYERLLLAQIRSLSLGVHANNAVAMNSSGSKARDYADLQQIKSGNVVSLLA